jgi:hypothetical protein
MHHNPTLGAALAVDMPPNGPSTLSAVIAGTCLFNSSHVLHEVSSSPHTHPIPYLAQMASENTPRVAHSFIQSLYCRRVWSASRRQWALHWRLNCPPAAHRHSFSSVISVLVRALRIFLIVILWAAGEFGVHQGDSGRCTGS